MTDRYEDPRAVAARAAFAQAQAQKLHGRVVAGAATLAAHHATVAQHRALAEQLGQQHGARVANRRTERAAKAAAFAAARKPAPPKPAKPGAAPAPVPVAVKPAAVAVNLFRRVVKPGR